MNAADRIPPNRKAEAEALTLSADILRNIELNEIPLGNIAFKSVRLARLLNDFRFQQIMENEISGYPNAALGPLSAEVASLAIEARRNFQQQDSKTKLVSDFVYTSSIAELEALLASSQAALEAGGANSNIPERNNLRQSIMNTAQQLASRRNFLYQYALKQHYELKFSGIADDIFTRLKEQVDKGIGEAVPKAAQKFAAVYENLQSENSEDWSNAVHSCRRIIQDLADVVFPATEVNRVVEIDGKTKEIKLGNDQYINRIIAFVQDNSDSGRFEEIVGSHLRFLGERLDSIVDAAHKGTHAEIVSRNEADRYVVYTYLLVGDILSLYRPNQTSINAKNQSTEDKE